MISPAKDPDGTAAQAAKVTAVPDSGVVGYASAVLAVAMAYAFRLLVDPVVHEAAPFFPFILAVVFAVLISGRGPGILAGILSVLAGVSFVEPVHRYTLQTALQIAIFMLVCFGIGWLDARRSRQTAVAMRASRELELFVDQVQDYAIFMVDTLGRVRTWNTGAERLLGWTRGRVIGLPASRFFSGPDPEQSAAAQLEEVRRTGQFTGEVWQKRSDGSEFLANLSISLVADEHGEEIGFAKVVFDTTARRSRELALQRREEHLNSILATVPDAMVVIDEQGIILSFSATAEKLFGYSQADVLGRNVDCLMPSPHRENHNGYLERYLATGEKRIIGIGRAVAGQRSDGSVFPMHLSVGEAGFGDQRLFTGFIQDLSERQAVEAKIAQLQQELIHVSRLSAMGTMATTLAHELNQPLTAIASYAEAAKIVVERDEADLAILREALGELASQSLRAGSVVRRLREFVSRGDLVRTSEDLPRLIEESAAWALLGTADKGISTRYSFDQAANPVFVDRVQIQQVLINLIRNAVEAMEHSNERKLVMGTELVDTATVRVTVSDTGSGIPDEIRERMFEAFNSSKPAGMGLGLSICRTIVEGHGGKIEIASRTGGGSVFSFTLALAAQSNNPQLAHRDIP